MNRRTPELLTRWLTAEDGLNAEAAEAALAALVVELPDLLPRPGFAARVMTETRATALRPAGALSRRWARATLLCGLVLSGVATLWLLPLAWLLAPRPSAPGGVRLVAELLRTVGETVVLVAGWSNVFGALCRSLVAPFDHPTVLVSLALLISVAAGAFILLETLIRRERSWSYVDL